MKVEGIIIQKIPYKEKDLIAKLLSRSGEIYSLYLHGAQGGGRKHKFLGLDLGHLVKLELRPPKKYYTGSFYTVKEAKLLWAADNLRHHYQAFELEMFFLETMSKVALEREVGDEGEYLSEETTLFNVLSNALYYLNLSVDEDLFLSVHLFVFLAKLTHYLGIAPQFHSCQFCEQDLTGKQNSLFDIGHGAFVCLSCIEEVEGFQGNLDDTQMHDHYLEVLESSYAQMKFSQVEIKLEESRQLFKYLCYQFHLKIDQFRTARFLFR